MSSMFTPKVPAPPPPVAPKPVAPMPDPFTPAVQDARSNTALELAQRGARSGTILTSTLGGQRDRLG